MAKSESFKTQGRRVKKPYSLLIDSSGSSMTHWSIETGEAQAKKFAQGLVEDARVKKAGLKFLEDNNLPRYSKISVGLAEFIQNSEEIFTQFPSTTGFYYSSIVDLKTGARVFGLEQTPEQVKKFIADKLANQEISINSELTLSEYWRNYYGGNLLINNEGKVLIELVEGKHAKLNKGQGQVLMTVKTDPNIGILRFNEQKELDDDARTRLREALINVLRLIPQHLVPLTPDAEKRFKQIVLNENGEACVALPHAGYYEFILTKADSEIKEIKAWRIIFLDARTGQAADKYQIFD